VRNADAAEHHVITACEGWTSKPDPTRTSPEAKLASASAPHEIVRGGQLDVAALAIEGGNGQSGPLRERSVIGKNHRARRPRRACVLRGGRERRTPAVSGRYAGERDEALRSPGILDGLTYYQGSTGTAAPVCAAAAIARLTSPRTPTGRGPLHRG